MLTHPSLHVVILWARRRRGLLLHFHRLRRVNFRRFDLHGGRRDSGGRRRHWSRGRGGRCHDFRGFNLWRHCRSGGGHWRHLTGVGLRRFDLDGRSSGRRDSGLASVNLWRFDLAGAKLVRLDFTGVDFRRFNLGGRGGDRSRRRGRWNHFNAASNATSLSYLIYSSLNTQTTQLFGSAAATSVIMIGFITVLVVPVLLRVARELTQGKT